MTQKSHKPIFDPAYTDEQIESAVDVVEWSEKRNVFLKFHDGLLSAWAPPGRRLDRLTIETLKQWRPVIKYVLTEVANKAMTQITFKSFEEYADALRRRRIAHHIPLPPPQRERNPDMVEHSTHRQKRYLSKKFQFIASKLLDAKLTKVPGTDYVVYTDGYSDEQVAKEIEEQSGKPVSLAAIRNLRIELFGRVTSARHDAQQAGADSAEIERLHQHLHRLTSAHNELVERVQSKVQLGAGWPNLKIQNE